MKQKFNVTGMTCSACSAHVEKSVRKVEGVNQVTVNLLSNSMVVEYDPDKTDDGAIVAAVKAGGYGAALQEQDRPKGNVRKSANDTAKEELRSMKKRLVVSFVFLIPLFYLSMGHMMGLPVPAFFHGNQNAMAFAFTQFLLTLPILVVNHKYFRVGFKTLFKGAPNMDSLIAIGSSAAVVYGVFAIYKIGWGLGHGDMAMVERYTMDLYFKSEAKRS